MAGFRRKKGGKAGFENPYCTPSERPAAHTQQILTQVPPLPAGTPPTFWHKFARESKNNLLTVVSTPYYGGNG